MGANKKRLIALIASLTLCATAAGCSGPGRKDGGGAVCLDVYCVDAGYGTDWCADMLNAFRGEDWVKEKYPGLKTSFRHNDQQNFAESKLKAGAKNNDFDLLFGTILQTWTGVENLAELTDGVYRQKVPGEDITYEEKCDLSYNEVTKYIDPSEISDHNRYYIAPWAGGVNGIFYNEELLNGMGLAVPRTTGELEEECRAILSLRGNKEGKYDKGYSFIAHKSLAYQSYLFPIWWAQYQGISSYIDFWNGIDDGGISKNIFKQKGRLYSLKTYEKLFFYDWDPESDTSNAFLTPKSLGYEFMTAQSMFLKGNGVFHVNGDWFEHEMAEMRASIVEETGIDYTIKMMRTPIISELGEKLGITEEELRSSVDYADGKTDEKPVYAHTAEGYGDDDVLNAVISARGIIGSLGPNHTGFIPVYAKDKEAAMDFLRFMATDKAQEIYIRATMGCMLPFRYDLRKQNRELYDSLTPMQKARHDYFNSDRLTVYTLPDENAFPLRRFSGLRPFTTDYYWTVFSKAGCTQTAQSIYDRTISDWTDKKWDDALGRAGIR